MFNYLEPILTHNDLLIPLFFKLRPDGVLLRGHPIAASGTLFEFMRFRAISLFRDTLFRDTILNSPQLGIVPPLN